MMSCLALQQSWLAETLQIMKSTVPWLAVVFLASHDASISESRFSILQDTANLIKLYITPYTHLFMNMKDNARISIKILPMSAGLHIVYPFLSHADISRTQMQSLPPTSSALASKSIAAAGQNLEDFLRGKLDALA